MLMQCLTSYSPTTLVHANSFSTPNHNLITNPKKSSHITCLLHVGFDDVAHILHNKVLLAGGISGAIGQISKPFTSVILYRKDFDFKIAFQAGGFPSTHSSSVVAAATCIGLERGFSDSIFGLAVVYAGLVMYDAQGVRREVGAHAKALNKIITKARVNRAISSKDRDDLIDSSVFKTESIDFKEETESYSNDLKESIGHTELEVVAGALLGFFVSLVVCTLM